MHPVLKLCFRIESALYALRRRKDVLLLFHNEMLLEHILPIFALLAEDPRIRIWFCNSEDESLARTALRPRGVPGWRILPYRLAKNILFDLIVYSEHDDYFRTACHKIYVGHGLSVGKIMPDGMPYDFCTGARFPDGTLIYDKYFRSSQTVIDMACDAVPDACDLLRNTGNLYIEGMTAQPTKRRDRATVAIASSWGPNSLFNLHGDALVRQLPALSERYDIVIAVHPNLLCSEDPAEQALLAGFKSLQSDAIRLNDDPRGSIRAISGADLLVCDFTSVGLYYCAMQRPILYVDCPGFEFDPKMSLIPKLKAASAVTDNIDKLAATIDRTMRGFDASRMAELAAVVFGDQSRARTAHRRELYDSLGLTD